MKNCPFCAEEIQEEAVKCRFCGEYFDDKLRKAAGQKPQWYFKASSLIIGFLFVGPFIIPLIWFNPRYSSLKKVILTMSFVVVSILLFFGLKASFAPISQYFEVLQGNVDYF